MNTKDTKDTEGHRKKVCVSPRSADSEPAQRWR